MLHDVGGVPVLMKALLDGGYLHGDCMTVTGKTVAENLRDVVFPTGQNVVMPTSRAIGADRRPCRPQRQSRTARRPGEGRRHEDRLRFTGPARCFDSEEEAFAAVEARRYRGAT